MRKGADWIQEKISQITSPGIATAWSVERERGRMSDDYNFVLTLTLTFMLPLQQGERRDTGYTE
jgi:hypothetical protein